MFPLDDYSIGFDSRIYDPYFLVFTNHERRRNGGFQDFMNAILFICESQRHKCIEIHEFTIFFFNFYEFMNDSISRIHEQKGKRQVLPSTNAAGGGKEGGHQCAISLSRAE